MALLITNKTTSLTSLTFWPYGDDSYQNIAPVSNSNKVSILKILQKLTTKCFIFVVLHSGTISWGNNAWPVDTVNVAKILVGMNQWSSIVNILQRMQSQKLKSCFKYHKGYSTLCPRHTANSHFKMVSYF